MAPSIKKSRDVLFLGQSGGGKSTTINTMANICAYNDYKTAVNRNEPVVLIPLQFDVNYPDKSKDTIKMGGIHMADAGNEQTANPELSCTQSPRIYSFIKDDKAFNFIDMPGFGDTSGAGQDEEHKIQRHEFLRSLTELHAIVVVLDSTQSRLSPHFIAALNDVLALVPKAAISNLFFIGTRAITTNFTGGTLIENLQNYLNDVNKDYENKYNQKLQLSAKDNMYFVDYDGFRHLVAKHRCQRYREMTQYRGDATNNMSWNKTRDALFALMSRVIGLQGVSTSIIGDIDLARSTIEVIIDAMMEIMVEVETMKTPERMAQVRSAMEKYGHISPPCTFCNKCKSQSKQNGLFKVTPRICHRNCQCSERGLNECNAFQNGRCKTCRCPAGSHFNGKDNSCDDPDGKVKTFIANYDNQINKECQQITRVVTMAASFLKENTILPFSRSHETRLETEINKCELNGDIDMAEERAEVLNNYRKRVAEVEYILNKTTQGSTSSDQFKKSLENLFKLQITGELIKNLYNDRTRHEFNFEEPCVYKATYFPEWK